jgi:nicotinamidase-related amidase
MTMVAAESRSTPFIEWLDSWLSQLPEASLQADVLEPAGGPAGAAFMSVDLLTGFCSEGPLSSPRVGALVPRIIDLLARAHAAGVRQFLLTQDSHPEDAPEFRQFGPHCITGTREAETVPELLALPFADQFTFIRKRSLSSAESTELEAWLEARPQLRRVVIVGDCTDLCVYQAAMHLRLRANARGDRDFEVVVPADCVDTYDLPVEAAGRLGVLPHDGELMHQLFLYHMALNGVQVVRRLH